MASATDFIFLKQAAHLPSYFSDLCVDVTGSGSALVFSEIRHEPVGGVRFVTGPRYRRTSGGQRMRTWLWYLLAAFWQAFRVRGNPVLFIVAQPPLLPLLGYVQKKLLGRRYVLWIDDVWPDVIVRRGLRPEASWLVRAWRAFNRLTYRHAEHVFTLGPGMRENVLRYLPPGAEVSIVPTWVDTDTIRPLPKEQNPFAREHRQLGKITVTYSGNLGATHDLGSILEAARRLRDREDLAFMIIGEGDRWNEVRDSIAAHQDRNITLLPFQPSEVLPQSLATADIALVSMDEGMAGISLPSKTYSSLAAGSAVVASCPATSDLARIVRDNQCGVCVPPRDPEALANAIAELAADLQRLKQLRANARRAAQEKYSRQVNTSRVRALLAAQRLLRPVEQDHLPEAHSAGAAGGRT